MRDICVTGRPGVTPERIASVSEILRKHATLQDVLEWCRAQAPPANLADVVVQDEFTHDVVLGLGSGLFAVYDAT